MTLSAVFIRPCAHKETLAVLIGEVLPPFGCFFGSFLNVFGCFLGFENIVGAAQSVVENIVGGAQSVVNGTHKKEKRGTLCAPTRGHPYFGSLLEPQGFPHDTANLVVLCSRSTVTEQHRRTVTIDLLAAAQELATNTPKQLQIA